MPSPVQKITIDSQDDVGQRLDNYLMRMLKGVPRQHIYKILRKGEVRVNGSRVKAPYRLRLNDIVRIPPVHTRAELPVQYSNALAHNLTQATLYEDDDYLVIDKPRGLAVHGGSGSASGVIEIMRDLSGNGRLSLVHRIDRETSGCLAMAKNNQALRTAQAAFRARRTKKVYEAIVWGTWSPRVRTVQTRLKRTTTDWGERRVKPDPTGQSARTDFEVLHACVGEAPATWLRATLHTGRTHQIRAHALSQGHPIAGDEKYVNTRFREIDSAWSPPMCLHASKLRFATADREVQASSPVPEDMQSFWTTLGGGLESGHEHPATPEHARQSNQR